MKIKYYIPDVGKEEKDAVSKVLDSGHYTHGKECEEFENLFAEACGAKYALSTNSCTSALHMACLHYYPSCIRTTPYTYCATWQAIVHAGKNPFYKDIEKNGFFLKEEEESIFGMGLVNIIVHFAGQEHNIERNDIEDCAHRFPSKLNGHIACYSFYANKLITTGEGGMLVTNSKEVRDMVYELRYHGRDKYTGDYNINRLGYKYNMSDIQAAMGIEQLKKMPLKRERHLEIADLYNRYLDPEVNRIDDHTCHYHLYPIFSEKAEQIKQALRDNEIEYSHHYKIFVESKKTLPNAYKMSEQEISLPIYMSLKNEEVKYICEIINRSI